MRTGIAPDHSDMKRVTNDLARILKEKERCRFFGNVLVGNGGLPIEKLKELYSGVVFAYGTTSDKKLGLPNEFAYLGVHSSRRIANWYNGSLDNDIDYQRDLNLENVRDLAIIGNGNVAMDIARIFLKSP